MYQLVGLMMLGVIGITTIYAEEGVCQSCQQNRKKNITEHKNYEYYEDYLKEQEQVKTQPPENAMRKAFAPYLRNKTTEED